MTDEEVDAGEFSETDVPRSFNILSWVRSVPLTDDLWLRMQAQHIAAVEVSIIRPLELHTARVIFSEEPYSNLMMALNGVSQMWLFSLYEFLRTWRQRATSILKLASQYEKTLPRKKAAFLAKTLAEAKDKEKHIHSGFSFYSKHVSEIANPNFVSSVRVYYDKTNDFFHWIEGLRMNLAKHEVPKTKGMVAEMPGYARMDMISGTLYWQYIDTHGGLEKLDRREAANFFLDIVKPDMDDPDDRY